MLRARATRPVVTTALVAAVAGVGWTAYTLGAAGGEDTAVVPRAEASGAPGASQAKSVEPGSRPADPPAADPAAPGTPAATYLTLDEIQAVALEAAPGRVVDVDEDDEPTGLRYDVTVLHDDRTSTDVEVDATTGEITSIDHDRDRD